MCCVPDQIPSLCLNLQLRTPVAAAPPRRENQLSRRYVTYDFLRRYPGVWLNPKTSKGDYVCAGNFLLKRHPYAIPFLDLWINSGDVDPDLKVFHTEWSHEQRPLNALVRSP